MEKDDMLFEWGDSFCLHEDWRAGGEGWGWGTGGVSWAGTPEKGLANHNPELKR